MASEIVFESNRGIVFERSVNKSGRCKLSVKNRGAKRSHADYRYKNVPGLSSPYINWANLNCCDGWAHDKTYLHTAVQNGHKLFAGIGVTTRDDDPLTKQQADDLYNTLKHSLPDDCVMGYEARSENRNGPNLTRHIFICKAGAIKDYINLDDVFDTYRRLGVHINDSDRNVITEWCGLPLQSFAGEEKSFDYGYAGGLAQLIVTGLLLGYPLETTASFFC